MLSLEILVLYSSLIPRPKCHIEGLGMRRHLGLGMRLICNHMAPIIHLKGTIPRIWSSSHTYLRSSGPRGTWAAVSSRVTSGSWVTISAGITRLARCTRRSPRTLRTWSSLDLEETRKKREKNFLSRSHILYTRSLWAPQSGSGVKERPTAIH